MNTTSNKSGRRLKCKALSGKSLEIRVIKRSEHKRFDETLGKYHYIGESRSVGDSMRMVAEVDGEWIGLLMWGSSAYRLKDRDEFIGWNNAQRAQRQKLVVQNRRFLLLSKRGENPNLASMILGATVRMLPELWFDQFGYKPLLAETFTDREAGEGTCYKASGWIPLGMTKGYSRHRADFYVPNERPKKLWVRELCKDAASILRGPDLTEEYQKGAQSDADGVLPIKAKELESLHFTLCQVEDPRTRNRTFHIGSILSIVAMAVFSGHRNLAQIVRFGERLHISQRKAIGLPLFKKGSSYRKTPSYKVYYNLLSKLDIDKFAQCLSQWLQQHSGTLPASLALDGKFIRDTVGIVCMVDHETGVPHAMAKASKKEGEGKDCEMKAAQRMIRQQEDLSGKVITADPLHCQRETANEIVAKGGEFIFQLKDNQKNARKTAETKTRNLSPFLNARKTNTAE